MRLDIKLSQAVVDSLHSANVASGLTPNSPNLAAILGGSGTQVLPEQNQAAYWSYYGSTLEINLGYAGMLKFDGVSIPNLAAQHGIATATTLTMTTPTLSLTQQGLYSVDYSLINNVLSLEGITGHTVSGQLFNGVWPWSPDYDPLRNNMHVEFTGTLDSDKVGNVTGKLTEVDLQPKWPTNGYPLYTAAEVVGDLSVYTNGATHKTELGGTIMGMRVDYWDDSYELMSSAAIQVNNDTKGGLDLLADSANFAGDDHIKVTLPDTLYAPVLVAAGRGNDFIELLGGGGNLNVDAGDGDDFLWLESESRHVNGGSGLDKVLFRDTDRYVVKRGPDGITVSSLDDGSVVTLTNVERVSASGRDLAFDLAGNAGQAYRLYTAALGRAPDMKGLGYWISALDHGATLASVARGFINSAEFTALVGANVDDATFLNKLYSNILHRAPDSTGFNYWLDVLHSGAQRDSVLVNFSESAENQAQVVGSIENGIPYLTYVG